jgi:hypothetical protein
MNPRFWWSCKIVVPKRGTKEINVPDIVNGFDLSISDESLRRLDQPESPLLTSALGVRKRLLCC